MEYNFRIDTVRWRMSKSTKVARAFFSALARAISEKLTFQICYLQKISQGHGVQFSKLRHSMANVKIYNSIFLHF